MQAYSTQTPLVKKARAAATGSAQPGAAAMRILSGLVEPVQRPNVLETSQTGSPVARLTMTGAAVFAQAVTCVTTASGTPAAVRV